MVYLHAYASLWNPKRAMLTATWVIDSAFFFWGYGVTQHSETLVMSPWLSLLRTLAPRPLLSSRYDSKRAPPVLRRGRWAPSVGEWLLFPAGWATLSLRKPHPLQLCIFTNQTVCELFPDYFGTLKFHLVYWHLLYVRIAAGLVILNSVRSATFDWRNACHGCMCAVPTI